MLQARENTARPFALKEKLLRYFCEVFLLNSCWPLTSIILGNVTVCPEICRRFGGGSDRNRALLGNKGNSMHGMQIAQSPINIGDSASR